jgi:UPF0042 nucleotide-binding protein
VTRREARIVFVSGLSGSGKSTAMAALEDVGFYCADNLPVQLVEQFLDLCAKADPPIEKIALALDARETQFLAELPPLIEQLRSGRSVDVIFLEASVQVLVNRYRETRRVHPRSPEGRIEEGIEVEASRPIVVNLISFGFRYGTPQTMELLFDVRFLANPYFDTLLRPLSGSEPEVSDYVLKNPRGAGFFERLEDWLDFLLPLFEAEGKAYVTIGFGCTGGRHRSVAVVDALAAMLRESGREVNVEHRDVEKSQ